MLDFLIDSTIAISIFTPSLITVIPSSILNTPKLSVCNLCKFQSESTNLNSTIFQARLFTIRSPRCIPSSSLLSLYQPPITTHVNFFIWAISHISAPRLWHGTISVSEFLKCLVPSSVLSLNHHHLHQAPLPITHQAFHSKLKSHLFKNSYPVSSDLQPFTLSGSKLNPP